LDARALAHFADVIRPTPRPLPDAQTQELRALLGHRQQLVAMRTTEQNRLAGTSGRLIQDIEAHIAWLNARIATLDDDLETMLRASPLWREHDELLQSAKGIEPVCPFVPEALERKTLWLASEHIAGRSVAEVVQLINGYKTQFLRAQPIDGDGTTYKSLVVVFTDLSADRAKGLFDDVTKQLVVPSYVEDGLVMGGFYENNEGTAVYNQRPLVPRARSSPRLKPGVRPQAIKTPYTPKSTPCAIIGVAYAVWQPRRRLWSNTSKSSLRNTRTGMWRIRLA
jgi:hypothetical protein